MQWFIKTISGRVSQWTCLLLLCCMAAPRPAWVEERSEDSLLVDSLRKGGYNIYFRHASTDWSQNDRVVERGDWRSCRPDRMRQLSPAGLDTASRIGDAIRRLAIPVGAVFSSEYCRTRQTAQAMALGPVSTSDAVMNMRAAQFVGGRKALIDRARRALSTAPPEGTNTVFVAHGNLVRSATGAYPAEAGAVIFLPLGNGDVDIVAELTPEDWTRLAEALGSKATEKVRDPS